MVVRLISSSSQPPLPPPLHRPPLRVVPPLQDPPTPTSRVARDFQGPQAFLVDEPWPEYTGLVAEHALAGDTLAVPMLSQGPMQPPTWPTPSGVRVHASSLIAHLRRQELSTLTTPGARLRAQLKYDDLLARSYAALLGPSIRHVVVSQNLLPFLWNTGVLRRRTFDVLMTRHPLAVINERARHAQARHPTNATAFLQLVDSLITDDETEALRAARRVITPHAEVASLLGHKATLVPWVLPDVRLRATGHRVVYPGPAAALDGAYEVRAAMRRMDGALSVVESRRHVTSFWRGVKVEPRAERVWLDDVRVVVHPVWVCAQPRQMLMAIAAGLPVVTTYAAGLPASAVGTMVPVDNVDAVVAALQPGPGGVPRAA